MPNSNNKIVMSNGDEVPIYRGHWVTTSIYRKIFVLGQSNPDKAKKQADGDKSNNCPNCGSNPI